MRHRSTRTRLGWIRITRICLARVLGMGALILLIGAFTVAAAESPAPERAPRPPGPVDEADRVQAPAASPQEQAPAIASGPAQQRVLPALPGEYRESLLTEGAAPGTLTDLERAKLALARAAVEAARAAESCWDDAALARARAAKLERWRAASVVELVPDPAAGVGDFPSVQEVGPAGPTEAELAKLRGEIPASASPSNGVAGVAASPPSDAPDATPTARREQP